MNTLNRLSANLEKVLAAGKETRSFLNEIIDAESLVETDVFTAGQQTADGAEGLGEGVVTGYASVNGRPVCLFAQNRDVMGGSFSSAQARKIAKMMDMAVKTGSPFLSVIDSAGARLDEGAAVLEGYAGLIASSVRMKGIVPHIAVIKGACVGMMADFAATADFVIVDSEKGYISQKSPAVLAAEEKLSAKAEKLTGAQAMSKSGLVDLTYDSPADLKAKISALFELYAGADMPSDDANRISDRLNSERSVDALIEALCDNGRAVVLGGESCIVTALAKVNGYSVGIIASNPDKADGKLCKGGIEKATAFVKKLDMLGLPLITLVNAKGIKSNMDSEVKGFAYKAAALMSAIALSDIDKIAVITGNAIGYAYSALCSKAIGFDYTVAFADASIAPVSAETAVNFLDDKALASAKDPVKAREKLIAGYTEREGNPFITAKDGFIDNIIEPATLRPYIASVLNMLVG